MSVFVPPASYQAISSSTYDELDTLDRLRRMPSTRLKFKDGQIERKFTVSSKGMSQENENTNRLGFVHHILVNADGLGKSSSNSDTNLLNSAAQ